MQKSGFLITRLKYDITPVVGGGGGGGGGGRELEPKHELRCEKTCLFDCAADLHFCFHTCKYQVFS